MCRKFLFATFLIAGCATGAADETPPAVASPDIPDTEIFFGRIRDDAGGRTAAEFRNVTIRKGYDNQPYFIPGEEAFYFVSEGESGKTDISRYDLKLGASAPVFVSADRSEFSPRRAPGGELSYIQENPAGDVTRVHRRAPGAAKGAAVADFAPVGYYAWLDGGAALAVYFRSDPGSLHRIDVASGATSLVREKIGRAMEASASGDSLWFAAIEDAATPSFRLMRYDSAGGEQAPLFPLPDGAQDFAIDFDNRGEAVGVYSAAGSALYWRSLGAPESGWRIAADLSPYGIAKASRVAVDREQGLIAVVGEASD